jgi:hypothetical protein
MHEDQVERVPGPEIGDYLGLPINDAMRLRGESWDASILTMEEHTCKPHPSTYGFRGIGNLRITANYDPTTFELTKLDTHIQWMEQRREIWMDGRPHPPEFDPHTWQGFSTGRWEGNVLVVTDDTPEGGMDPPQRPGAERPRAAHRAVLPPRRPAHAHLHHRGPGLPHRAVDQDERLPPDDADGDAAVSVPAGGGSRPRSGRRAAPPARPEPVHRRVREEAQPAAGGDARRRRDGAARVREEAGEAVIARPLRLLACAAACGAAFAAVRRCRRSSPTSRSRNVQGNVWLITAGGVNVAAQIGSDGVLVVDTGTAGGRREDPRRDPAGWPGDKPIRFILNTNADADNTGGNAVIAKAGRSIIAGNFVGQAGGGAANAAKIIAHENVPAPAERAAGDAARGAVGGVADRHLLRAPQRSVLQRRAGADAAPAERPRRRPTSSSTSASRTWSSPATSTSTRRFP